MKHMTGTLALLCSGVLLAAAEPLLKAEKISDFQGIPRDNSVEVNDSILKIKKNDRHFVLTTAQTVAIDPAKTYEFSCAVRANEKVAKAGGRGLLMGVVCNNDKGRRITPVQVLTRPQLTTELAGFAKAGSKTIMVKDASLWKVLNGFVVFNAKKDMSDLPNFNSIKIEKIEKKGEVWEITLKRPLRTAFPAGTVVRNHFDGMTFIYAPKGAFKPDTWVTLKITLKGIAAQGEQENAAGKFRAGTAFAGIAFLTGPKLNEEIEIKDIRITSLE